jgi:tetratricopeptide (TPR) repeat protein
MQTELALETGQAGLAVLYAQQYLLYYPGSLHGFYLLGQAREAESKYDLALNAYSRAVAGDTSDEIYTGDPYFLENLLARADLLVQQGRQDEAADDFSLALQLAGDNPALRVRRLQASFSAGDYADVLLDVEELLGDDSVEQNEVLYYQGLSLIALAQAGDELGDYELAIEALNDALSRNLPANLRPNAYENLAFVNLEEGNYNDALEAINNAIESSSTAYRIYLRGQILEGQNNSDEALLDYEFIVTWGQYFDLPFYENALERYQQLASGRR